MACSYTTSEFHMKETTGIHRVKINTSLTGGIQNGRSIQCGTFTVGEYQWAILYFPKGIYDYSSVIYLSFYVELLSEAKDVDVFLCFSLLDQNGIASNNHKESNFFTYKKKGDHKGFATFLNRYRLDGEFVEDDCFIVECSLKILEPSIEHGKNNSISVPPSNMHQHLHNLLQSGEGADISFKVKGETFPAHRIILASRSSVFRAELLGSMSESTASCVEIQDIEPQIFKALLQYIYTDMLPLPPSDNHTDESVDEDIVAHHLIVAADRYALERLRLICEERLAKKINADNVVTTLALATQHNCQQLKELCLEYISSSKILHSLIETDVFASLTVSCPSINTELLKKVTSNRKA